MMTHNVMSTRDIGRVLVKQLHGTLWFLIITIVTIENQAHGATKTRNLDIVYNVRVVKCYKAKGDKAK